MSDMKYRVSWEGPGLDGDRQIEFELKSDVIDKVKEIARDGGWVTVERVQNIYNYFARDFDPSRLDI